MWISKIILLILLVFGFSFESFSEELSEGIGPVKGLKLESFNKELATKGRTFFVGKCSACHKIEERYVGPALKGVTERRSPSWIMNMILNPAEMVQKDPTALSLLEEFLVPMTFQNVSQDEARAILEYFRNPEVIDGEAKKAEPKIVDKKIKKEAVKKQKK